MSKKVVLFNGAPNSGKDASALIMKELFGFGSIHAFKDELYKATAKHFDVDLDKFIVMARDRVLKETKTRILNHKKGMSLLQKIKFFFKSLFTMVGLTPREALIFVSEKIIKPQHGNDFFGKQLANTINLSKGDMFFIPDSGFVDELRPLVEAGYDVHVIRIHRDGTSFENDSRTEMTDEILKEFGIKGYDLYNNGTLGDLREGLLSIATNQIALGKNKL